MAAQSEDAYSNAGADADRCHCAEVELGPVLVFNVGKPEVDSAIETVVNPASRRDNQIISMRVVIRKVELPDAY